MNNDSCATCLKKNCKTKCECKQIAYCSKACQNYDWNAHKLNCARRIGEFMEDGKSAKAAEPTFLNKTVALIFTDIKSSSKLWKTHGDAMFTALETHNERIRAYTEKNNGMIVKTIGDAFMIVFENSQTYIVDAVSAALQIQRSLKRDPIILGKDKLQIRLGIAYGPVIITISRIQNCANFRDFFGPVVNKASRMESKVSPVGGLAIALNPDIDMPEDAVELLNIGGGEISYQDFEDNEDGACDISSKSAIKKFRRSLRMLDVRNFACKNSKLMFGVGPTEVIVYKL